MIQGVNFKGEKTCSKHRIGFRSLSLVDSEKPFFVNQAEKIEIGNLSKLLIL